MGLDWLDKLEIGLQGGKKTNVIRHVDEDERRERIVHEYEDLFRNNHTIKDLTIDIQLKKKRLQTDTTKKGAGPFSLSKHLTRRIRKTI